MKTKLLFLSIIAIITTSCNYSKSIKKDLLTGITSKGSTITCNDIYLTVENKKVNRSSFNYGEVFVINFQDVMGFVKENGNDFPGMSITVLNTNKDTILFEPDLYEQYSVEGINYNPLLIQAMLTAASPMHSGNKYTMYVHIWDKKGSGTYDSKFEFSLNTSKNIVTKKTDNVKYDEIYLFSNNTKNVITDNKVNFNEPAYIIFEGLSGFKSNDGKISLGLSLIATDSDGKTILNYPDLYNNEEISFEEFNSQIAPYIEFTGANANNPVTCIATIWDKNSDNKITSEITLNVE